MRIVQFDATSGGTVTAYRKPAISDTSTTLLMASSPSGMTASSRRCMPLVASASSRCVSPAATAIAMMVRCDWLLVSVCHVKKKPARVSGSAWVSRSAVLRMLARSGDSLRPGVDCSGRRRLFHRNVAMARHATSGTDSHARRASTANRGASAR